MAEEVRARLASAGLKVWDPAGEILPGENWATKVGDALKKSEAMVVILSPRSLQSLSVRRGIEYALGEPNFKGRLIPVVTHRGMKIPWILRTLSVVGPDRDPDSISRQVVKALGAGTKVRRSRGHAVKTKRNASTSKPATAN